jgi:hypothetical protein
MFGVTAYNLNLSDVKKSQVTEKGLVHKSLLPRTSMHLSRLSGHFLFGPQAFHGELPSFEKCNKNQTL